MSSKKKRNQFKIDWIDKGTNAILSSDPSYPNGIDLDISKGAERTCSTTLPYPAKRCGVYSVKCNKCQLAVMITTTGRADDPRTVKLSCRPTLH